MTDIPLMVDGARAALSCLADGKVNVRVHCGDVTVCQVIDTVDTRAQLQILHAVSQLNYLTDADRHRDTAGILAEARRLVLAAGREINTGSSMNAAANEMLDDPNMMEKIKSDLASIGFVVDLFVGITLYLCKISSLLLEPVYVYLAGPASSLKTRYADLTASLTPPEKFKHLTDLTKKALYYMKDLRHFVICLDEMDLRHHGLAVDMKVLRMIHSKGWVEIEMTRGNRTERRRVNGPVTAIQTTVATNFDDQDLSRHLLIELPDDPQRTAAVLRLMGQSFAGHHHVMPISFSFIRPSIGSCPSGTK